MSLFCSHPLHLLCTKTGCLGTCCTEHAQHVPLPGIQDLVLDAAPKCQSSTQMSKLGLFLALKPMGKICACMMNSSTKLRNGSIKNVHVMCRQIPVNTGRIIYVEYTCIYRGIHVYYTYIIHPVFTGIAYVLLVLIIKHTKIIFCSMLNTSSTSSLVTGKLKGSSSAYREICITSLHYKVNIYDD